MRILGLSLAALFSPLLAVATLAQIPSYGIDTFDPPADSRWAAITSGDVEGAYKLLYLNHPGASPELHDLAFQERLIRAHVLALKRAGTVASYQGYIAVLAGLATDMGDKHIWSRPTFVVAYPRWVGVIVSKRGMAWIVADTDEPHASLLGAALLTCDGIKADELARINLGGFRADWSVGAQQVQSAPWLLVDEDNPFIKRPQQCTFSAGGGSHLMTLEWTRIRRESLLPRLKAAIGAGMAGYDVRPLGKGYWIALQDLSSDKATEVVKSVEQQKSDLRAAEFVVLDVRGNGGGSSEVGRQLAVSLLGKDAVDSRLGVESQSTCGGFDGAWRASDGNIHNMQYLLSTVLQGGVEVKKLFSDMLRDAQAARAEGRDFSASIHCPSPSTHTAVDRKLRGLMKGRLILLTDNLCFSSCLAVTDEFRALGALHIGQTTDAATHFTEVREQYMPSGYSVFSTLQSIIDPNGPVRVGPYQPDVVYDGDISDTRALEAWVQRDVVAHHEL